MTTHRLAGIKVNALRREELLGAVATALDEREPLRVTFLNPDYARRALLSRSAARRRQQLRRGRRRRERRPTRDLAVRLYRAGTARHRLAGAGPLPVGSRSVAGRLPVRVRTRRWPSRRPTRLDAHFPGLEVAGTEHGYHDVAARTPGSLRRPRTPRRSSTGSTTSGADLVRGQPADAAPAALGRGVRRPAARSRRHDRRFVPRPRRGRGGHQRCTGTRTGPTCFA